MNGKKNQDRDGERGERAGSSEGREAPRAGGRGWVEKDWAEEDERPSRKARGRGPHKGARKEDDESFED